MVLKLSWKCDAFALIKSIIARRRRWQTPERKKYICADRYVLSVISERREEFVSKWNNCMNRCTYLDLDWMLHTTSHSRTNSYQWYSLLRWYINYLNIIIFEFIYSCICNSNFTLFVKLFWFSTLTQRYLMRHSQFRLGKKDDNSLLVQRFSYGIEILIVIFAIFSCLFSFFPLFYTLSSLTLSRTHIPSTTLWEYSTKIYEYEYIQCKWMNC